MGIEVIYLHKRNYEYGKTRGLAERLVKDYYKKKGHDIWRGEYLQWMGHESFYVHQKEKYELLIKEIKNRIGPKRFWRLIIYIKAFAGVPDFIMKKNDEFFFVEVKLNNENVKQNQLDTMILLKELNLKTIIVRLSDNKRIYKKELDLLTGKSYLKSYIPKLKQKW